MDLIIYIKITPIFISNISHLLLFLLSFLIDSIYSYFHINSYSILLIPIQPYSFLFQLLQYSLFNIIIFILQTFAFFFLSLVLFFIFTDPFFSPIKTIWSRNTSNWGWIILKEFSDCEWSWSPECVDLWNIYKIIWDILY